MSDKMSDTNCRIDNEKVRKGVYLQQVLGHLLVRNHSRQPLLGHAHRHLIGAGQVLEEDLDDAPAQLCKVPTIPAHIAIMSILQTPKDTLEYSPDVKHVIRQFNREKRKNTDLKSSHCMAAHSMDRQTERS